MNVSVTIDHHWADIQYLKDGNTWSIYTHRSDFTLWDPTSSQLSQWCNCKIVLVSRSL